MSNKTMSTVLAHIITVSLATIVGVLASKLFGQKLSIFGLGFVSVGLLALLAFLIFAIPLERGWLTQKSLLWKFLMLWEDSNDGKISQSSPKMVNICHLPGLIVKSCVATLLFSAYWIVCLVLGNIFLPILFGKYVKVGDDKDFAESCEIFPDIYIGGDDGLRFRPWMIFMLGFIIWMIYIGVKCLYVCILSLDVDKVVAICAWGTVSSLFAGVIWLMAKYRIFDCIWNLILAMNKKLCIVRKVPEK